MSKPVVAHVWSVERESTIFRDLLGRFQAHAGRFEHVSQVKADDGEADFRIYHRPQLEESLVRPCACVVHHDLTDPSDDHAVKAGIARYRESDLVICLNEGQARYLEAQGGCRVVVVPHGYDPALRNIGRSGRERGIGPIRLGMFSRRYPRLVKGEAFLYELAMRLDPDGYEFVLMGRDRDKDARFLKQLGFPVICNPKPDYADIMDAYRTLDALLVLSVAEGGPASVPEAVAAGVTIIGRTVGMIPDLASDPGHVLNLTDNAPEDAARIHAHFQKVRKAPASPPVPQPGVRPWAETVAAYEAAIASMLGRPE
jgi:glycosyltransferase involved in cell wall biosynthesis